MHYSILLHLIFFRFISYYFIPFFVDDFVRPATPSSVPVSIPTMVPTVSAPTVSAPTVSAPTVSAPTGPAPAIDVNSSVAVLMTCVLDYEISLSSDHFKQRSNSYDNKYEKESKNGNENYKEGSHEVIERRLPDISDIANIVDADIYFIEMAFHRYEKHFIKFM